jgi:N6-L-threonylcarbamoyladenine synthase
MVDHLSYQIIGQTLDDAAGEAFDKVAKMLGLGYPGGPIISEYAKCGDVTGYEFPRVDLTPKPERNEEGFLVEPEKSLNFSFSGLKTAVLKEVREAEKDGLTEEKKQNIAASFQKAVNETLTRNLMRAVKKYKPKSVLLSGGVAANLQLREHIHEALLLHGQEFKLYFPKPKYCTDNAAMIAAAAYFHAKNKDFTDSKTLAPDPNLKLPQKT